MNPQTHVLLCTPAWQRDPLLLSSSQCCQGENSQAGKATQQTVSLNTQILVSPTLDAHVLFLPTLGYLF